MTAACAVEAAPAICGATAVAAVCAVEAAPAICGATVVAAACAVSARPGAWASTPAFTRAAAVATSLPLAAPPALPHAASKTNPTTANALRTKSSPLYGKSVRPASAVAWMKGAAKMPTTNTAAVASQSEARSEPVDTTGASLAGAAKYIARMTLM